MTAKPCLIALALGLWLPLASLLADSPSTEPRWAAIEADWLEQARSWASGSRVVTTRADAAGGVDGVKNGKYAFHVGWQANPWWQVDLGEPVDIGRIVVYNRLDYAPGLHNADHLLILASGDGKSWTTIHRVRDQHFGGISGAPPLDVRLEPGQARGRFVRLQIPSPQPIWFHLDEVEVYRSSDSQTNVALRRPADQSSLSQWSTIKEIPDPDPSNLYPTKILIEKGRRLASDLHGAGVDTAPALRELDEIVTQLESFAGETTADQHRVLYLRTRRTIRRLAFTNPLLDFEKLLVCKRFTQDTYPDVCLNHMPWVSRPGGDICVVTLSGRDGEPTAEAVIRGQLGPGHVHGMDLWFDAGRVVFGYARKKTPAGPRDRGRPNNFRLRVDTEPTHIYEIDISGENLRQLTDSREWSDLDPTYLPSGDIAFVSERCGASLQCNEWDKDETSCNLYSMRADGSGIRRLSASKDGDYLPHTLDDGTIGYTRWEYQERGWAHIQSIWYVRPDGTGADALFKQHLNNPWALEDSRSIPGRGTSQLVAIATGHHTLAVGPVVVVTPSEGMNDSKAIRIVTPGVKPPEGGMSGTPVDQGGVLDGGGFYTTPWPLSDKYFLASYSYGDEQTDATGYAIYLIDVFGTKELIYRDPSISCFIPIPLVPRPKPPVLPDVTDTAKQYAVCAVADVTHGVDGVEPGDAKYLRVSHRLQWPYDNTHGGQRYTEKANPNNWTPVRILGDVPIAADGSAHFRVPADTPVYFQLLDENFMELRRMRSFISFQPGESRGCVGCHETRGEAPPVRTAPLAFREEPVDPAPPPWGERPISFLREVQPIFDRHCGRCHSGLKPAAGLDFSGGLTANIGPHASGIVDYGYNRAFETIITEKLVAWSPVQGDAAITQPLQFGSHRSQLVEVLRDGACSERAELTRAEWYRLLAWIDANAPYHDRFADKRPATPPYGLPNDRVLFDSLTALHQKRCSGCHDAKDVTRADWIDIHRPEQSLFLTAPLAQADGGRQTCGTAVYESHRDTDYRAVRQLVEGAVRKAWEQPRRDLQALVPSREREPVSLAR